MAIALAGCVAPPAPRPLDNEQPEPVACASRAQCDALWRRAQLFVIENAGFKVRIASDVLIETFGPHRSDATVAMRVTRSDRADGSGEIRAVVVCGMTLFDCMPTAGSISRSFFADMQAAR